jgi:hypothetical protein
LHDTIVIIIILKWTVFRVEFMKWKYLFEFLLSSFNIIYLPLALVWSDCDCI